MSNSPHTQVTSPSPCKGEDRRGSSASRFSRTKKITARARRLRRDSTTAERKLCYVLQGGQLDGLSFPRQHPLGGYILDFYCPAIRLAIEVDGGQHNGARDRAYDQVRSRLLLDKGVAAFRFWNNDVLENLQGVWDVIAGTAATLSSRRATPAPALPLSGGGSASGGGSPR